MNHVHNSIGPIIHHSLGETPSNGHVIARRTASPSVGPLIFDLVAQSSDILSARSDAAIGPLLAAATVPLDAAVLAIHPIWVMEALHRAHSTLKLFLMLHRSRPRIDRLTQRLEQRLALDLARNIPALTTIASGKDQNCARTLRGIARSLVALFGPGVGEVGIETDIDVVNLSRPRLRALVLLTHELIANAILHAFAGRRRGHIIVTLRLISPSTAILCVMDNGIGICDDAINTGGIAAGLATVLECGLYHSRTVSGFTKIEAIFGLEQKEAPPHKQREPFVHPENTFGKNERLNEAR
jgi:hypothetical protein